MVYRSTDRRAASLKPNLTLVVVVVVVVGYYYTILLLIGGELVVGLGGLLSALAPKLFFTVPQLSKFRGQRSSQEH